MLPQSKHAENNRKFFVLVMGLLVTLAWLALGVWGLSPYSRFLSHGDLGAVSLGAAPILFVYVAGWTLMTAAMMLPTSMPLVTMFYTLVRQRRDRPFLVLILIAGYLGVWTLFGVVVHLGDWGLHKAAGQNGWLHDNAWVIGAATLLAAGIYQFTPLKHRCLEQCRSPFSFIVQHWRGRNERVHALWLGVHHGIYCVGCCWSLMLLMFGIGVGNLGWMFVLGAVMAVEKNMPAGWRLSMPLGVLLVLSGVTVVLIGMSGHQ